MENNLNTSDETGNYNILKARLESIDEHVTKEITIRSRHSKKMMKNLDDSFLISKSQGYKKYHINTGK